jgi:hypothetical protein
MKLFISACLSLAFLVVAPGVAMAKASCYDLWYARNAIYDDYGYCFKTKLAKKVFDNSDCYEYGAPDFDEDDQEAIDDIVYQEHKRGCHVN